MKNDKKIFARERHYCPYSKNTTCDGWGCGEDCIFHPDFIDKPDCDICHFNKKNRGFEKKNLVFQEYWEADDKPCIMKKIPENINPARFAMSDTKTEELPECPYAQDLVCECIEQGLCDGSCRYHPDYEEYDDKEMEIEEEIEKCLKAYNQGYHQGYKKGYIAAIEYENCCDNDDCCDHNGCENCARDCPFDEPTEEDTEFESQYGMQKTLKDLDASTTSWEDLDFLPPLDFSRLRVDGYNWNDDLKKYHPCDRVRNFTNGVSTCVDCDKEICPIFDD